MRKVETNETGVGWPSVSVVIPVFNGAETVGRVVERCREALSGRSVEFVLVNDGSRDGSWERIEELASGSADVRGLDLSRNYGQHNALLAGVRAVRGELVVTIDDDLQNPPEEIPKLLATLSPEVDVVYGVPIVKRQGIGRRIATQLVVRALGLLGGRTAPMVSSFRLFRAELREGFAGYEGPDVSIDGLLTWRTERFASVPVRHDERLHGSSNYSLLRLVRHALTMITAFSTRPLRLATTFGFLVIVFGLGVLVYVVLRFFIEGHSVPGFPFLASIISIFAGAQLFAIGVIGEYLARMHVRVMAQPSYAIRAEVGNPGSLPGSALEAADEGGEICRALTWDSEFWGFPVARVVPERLDPAAAARVREWCDRHRVECAYFLASADDAESAAAAQAVGFVPIDTRITLERAAGSVAPPVDGSAHVRMATAADRPEVVQIACRAHVDTRFYFDPRFPSRLAGEMYARWVERGFEDDSRDLLVAELQGKAVGYLLLEKETHEIGLIAVDEAARGHGIGHALVATAIDRSPASSVRVVTQVRNVAALRLYEACGFRVEKAQTWYHRWA